MIRYIVIFFASAFLIIEVFAYFFSSPFVYIHDNKIDWNYEYINIGIQQRHPLHNHKLWITTYDGDLLKGGFKNSKHYLFDLKQKNVIGELTGINPGRYNDDLFCAVRMFSSSFTFFQGSHDRGMVEVELVSLQNGRSKKLGEIPFGGGGDGAYSPDRRYYQFDCGKNGNYVIDFEEKRLLSLHIDQNEKGGWWSNTEFVYIDRTYNLVKLNVETKQEEILLTPNQLQNFLDENQLQITHPEHFTSDTHWNGEEYEFLILHRTWNINSNGDNRKIPKEKWLLKISKNKKSLAVVSTNFPYKWNASYTPDL